MVIRRLLASAAVMAFALSAAPAPAHATTMDIAKILGQLLNQYQDELQGMDVEDQLAHTEEMSQLSGLEGLTGAIDKLKSMGSSVISGTDKYRPLVDPEIQDKLEDIGAVKDFASEKMIVRIDPQGGGAVDQLKELRTRQEVAKQAAALELLAAGITSKTIAQEVAEAQAELTEQSSQVETARENVQMLTGVTTQTIKQLAHIQLLQGSITQSSSADSLSSLTPVAEEGDAIELEEGTWSAQ